jgi:putative aldouronate transport system substrate-binding protein
MAVSMVMAGGRQSSGSSASGGRTNRTWDSLPLTRDNVTFSLFLTNTNNGRVTSFDYAENAYTKKIVDETGIKLDILAVPSSEYSTRFNAMMSSGDYTDIILLGLGRNDISYYAEQGILIALDDYDLTKYPNINKVMTEYGALFDKLRGADGKLYSLPAINECMHCIHSSGRGYYYMPFVRDNGLTVPQTLDEFTTYLRYVRDNDVNKNGNRNDEIPLAFSAGNTGSAIAFFAKAFMPYVPGGLGLNGGRVWEQYRDNEFRQALAYMNMLYNEGLIAEDSFSMTNEQVLALGENPVPILAFGITAWSAEYWQSGGQRWTEAFHGFPLEGPEGQKWGYNGDLTGSLSSRFYITDKCKDPELALAWYDYMINYKVWKTGAYGFEGVAWTDPDPGAVGLGGGPALYKTLIQQGLQPINTSWDQASPSIADLTTRLGEQADDVATALRWLETGDPSLLNAVMNNKSYAEIQYIWFTEHRSVPWTIPAEYFIPALAMSETDSARLTDINAVLSPYKTKAQVEFITGIRNINSDADWNAYLAELDRLNSREMAAIYQKYIK